MNIVSMGMKYLGPMVITKIASMLGFKGPIATKMIAAALPMILAAISGKAATSSGAGSLFGLLSNQDPVAPNDYEQALSGADSGNIASGGLEALSGLLGGSQVDALSGALGRYAGVPAQGSGSILGMLAPAVLGSLKGQVQDNNLDAAGLASFLADQKGNIASAIPADFASEAQGLGLLDAAPIAAAKAAVQEAAPKSGGMMKFLLPLIVLAGLAWYFMKGKEAEMPEMPEMADMSEMVVGDVNIGESFGNVVGGLTSTLGSITDVDSATAALPDLEQFSTELGSIGDLAGQLPEAGKGAFGGMVSAALSTIEPLIATALGAIGDDSPIKPILEGLLSKLTEMAG